MNQPLQKHQFLLGRLLNLQVLSHSEGFKGFDLPQALQALQHWREEDLAGLSQMLKDLEGEERFNRWKLIFQETAGPLASRTPALPLTLQRVYQQELAGLDPWLYLAWMQSLVAARLLEQKFGDQDPQVKGLLDGTILGAVDWFFPALGDLEATLLAQGPGPYRLTGRTPALVGRYLELNHLKTLFLVLAKLGSPEGEKLGLFLSAVGASPLVPVRGPVGVGAVDFAQPTEEAQLLEFIDPTCSVLALAADQVLLLQSSLCTQACQAALEAGQQKRVQDLEDPKKDMALLYHPLAADQLVEIKGLAEGLNGAVLQIAFYQDCLSQAKPGQEEYFSDLLELYRTVLKVYAGKHVPQALLSAVKLTGNDRSCWTDCKSPVWSVFWAVRTWTGAPDSSPKCYPAMRAVPLRACSRNLSRSAGWRPKPGDSRKPSESSPTLPGGCSCWSTTYGTRRQAKAPPHWSTPGPWWTCLET